MLSSKIERALRKITLDLNKLCNSEWMIVGSLSLYLNGVNITPEDIDILMSSNCAQKLNSYWGNYLVKKVVYSETNLFKSHFGVFEIMGVKVEVLGDAFEKIGGKWVSLMERLERRVYKEISGIKVPVSHLCDHYKSYCGSERIKDKEKCEKIIEVLKRNRVEC